jgi:NAD(P)-dependent dehydrogenase (short-subunit alcohol dehydrogenase family)
MNDGTGPLAGRVAIVTGASSGLGERFAQVLHADGADVVAVGRRADRLEALRGSLGDRLHPFACDLAIDDERERLVAEVNGRHGRIDVLVNNAGLGNAMPALDETLDHLRMVFEVNVIAVFHLCQLVGRLMIEAGSGTIVNMASILGLVASAPLNQASYCASKGAVVNLTRQLGSEWARKGVRVNALAPGWFPSEMTADMWEDEGTTSFVHRNTPIGRTGRPEELDDALRFLLAENNGFYTGQVLTVDGGWTAR